MVNSNITIEELKRISEALDEMDVPIEERMVQYMGIDGRIYTLSQGCFIDEYMYAVMPSHIKALYLGELDV